MRQALDDEQMRRAIEESKRVYQKEIERNRAGDDIRRVMAESGRAEDEIRRVMAESKRAHREQMERVTAEAQRVRRAEIERDRTEEDIILEYVKRQSLIEAELHRRRYST